MADEEQRWVNAARLIYAKTAPTYVQASTSLDLLTIRNLYHDGATLDQFREALEHAFGRRDVEKRKAFRYAVGIVRNQLRDARGGRI